MSLEKIEGQIVFCCDFCSEQLETETKDFDVAKIELEESNWTYQYVGGKYIHICPDCSGDY